LAFFANVVKRVDWQVASDVWGEGSALGELDWQSEAEADCSEAIADVCAGELPCVVNAVADGNARNEGDGIVDLDLSVSSHFEIPAFGGNVVVGTDAKVHRTSGGGEGDADFIGVVEDRAQVTLVLVETIAHAEVSCAEVEGDACIQLKTLIGNAADVSTAVVSANAIGGTSDEGDGVNEWHSEVDVGGDPVVSEVHATEDEAGVIADAEVNAEGFFWSAAWGHRSWGLATAGASRGGDRQCEETKGLEQVVQFHTVEYLLVGLVWLVWFLLSSNSFLRLMG